MNNLSSWFARVRASAWAPIAAKAMGFSALLAVLGLLGSGAFNRWVSPGTAAAAMAHGRPGKPARSSEPSATATTGAVEGLVAPPHVATPFAPESAPQVSGSASGSAPVSAMTADGRLILNLATAEELDRLPGIGSRKAQAIVELRTKLGGKFKRLEDLMRVRGIKRKFIERLRPLVVLDPLGG